MTYNKKARRVWRACSHFVATFLLFLLLASAALVVADQYDSKHVVFRLRIAAAGIRWQGLVLGEVQ